MDDKVTRLLRVFRNLTPEQKEEVLRELHHYEERGSIRESVEKTFQVSMGPLGGRCPYCGK